MENIRLVECGENWQERLRQLRRNTERKGEGSGHLRDGGGGGGLLMRSNEQETYELLEPLIF